MKLDDNKVIVTDQFGNVKEYDYMFSVDHFESGRTIVAFTDNNTKDTNRDVYFGFYPIDNYAGELYPVDTDKEKDLLEEAMKMAFDSMR